MDLLGGGVDLRHGHFSLKMYTKMKEFGPTGGSCAGVTVKNIPTREIILPVYFCIQKSVKNIPGVCFCVRQYVIGNTYDMH